MHVLCTHFHSVTVSAPNQVSVPEQSRDKGMLVMSRKFHNKECKSFHFHKWQWLSIHYVAALTVPKYSVQTLHVDGPLPSNTIYKLRIMGPLLRKLSNIVSQLHFLPATNKILGTTFWKY